MSRYHEENDVDATPPVVRFTRLSVDGLDVSPRALPTNLHARELVFEYQAVSFAGDNRVHYRCVLEGHDDEWLAAALTDDGQVRYTNLPAGRYRFLVQARTARSDWGPIQASNWIVLRGPITSRWWFQTLLVVGR